MLVKVRAGEQRGVWLTIWRAFLSELDQRGKLDWSKSFLDGSFTPAKTGASELPKPSGAKARCGRCRSTAKMFLWEADWFRSARRKRLKHPGSNICAPWWPQPSAKSVVASRDRPGLRQRFLARAAAQTRHVVDQPTPPRTPQTSLQRWPWAPVLTQALERRKYLCLGSAIFDHCSSATIMTLKCMKPFSNSPVLSSRSDTYETTSINFGLFRAF